MFYGGFGTNIKAARPVLAQAAVLSTLGVAGTAGAVGLFAHFALSLPWAESMLIGSAISDIQERIQLIGSKGYEHKAKLTILKEAARTLNYLTENNLLPPPPPSLSPVRTSSW